MLLAGNITHADIATDMGQRVDALSIAGPPIDVVGGPVKLRVLEAYVASHQYLVLVPTAPVRVSAVWKEAMFLTWGWCRVKVSMLPQP